MANFNKVILAGNLTRDPQLSYLPSNTPVCEFGMAINRKWRGQDGEMREDTCFVDLRIYGRRAEVINQYMSKGNPLLVEGRLKFDQWEGKDGGKRSKLYVIVDNFEFMGGPSGRSNAAPAAPAEHAAPAGHAGHAPSPAEPAGRHEAEAPPLDEAPPPGTEIPF